MEKYFDLVSTCCGAKVKRIGDSRYWHCINCKKQNNPEVRKEES